MADIEPITRNEKLLGAIAGEGASNIEPVTRQEHYLSAIAGESDLPAEMQEEGPITREEIYYQKILDNGGGGGGGDEPTGTKNISITQNGVSTHNVKAYASAQITTNVPNPSTGTKQINANGTHDVTDYASAQVNVPNSYSASDEGKVVDNGALVSQTSKNITSNGTVDTTLNNSVVVNVPQGITPTGTKQISIAQNGTTTEDVTNYANAQITVNVQGSTPSHTEISVLTIPRSTINGVDYKYSNGFQFMLSSNARKLSVSMKRIDNASGNNVWLRKIGASAFLNNGNVSGGFLSASLQSNQTTDGYDQYVFSVAPSEDTAVIFGQGWGDSTYSRLLAVKYFRVYDGSDNLLNEFLPVIKNGVVCFYDTVSEMYYLNSYTTLGANAIPVFFEGELTA